MSLVPDARVLARAQGVAGIAPDGRPEPALRRRLRRISSWANAASVLSVYAQAAAVMTAVVRWGHGVWTLPVWAAGFVAMGRTDAQLASLMHESAHRLLFTHRGLNDVVGRWLLGFPMWTSTDAYRRVHEAHHRREFGPDEPDLALYRGYPVSAASLRRKLWRDARGSTGIKLLAAQWRAGRHSSDPRVRATLAKILAVQVVLAVTMTMLGNPWLYPVLWLAPYLTWWRVVNRLRSIAEHAGMQASDDRRQSTHTVRQHRAARVFLVPFNIGYHLAHHLDAGIPWRQLPRYHRALVEAGYITPAIEYPSYRALWSALASR
jgi:fatty acid desaturase